MLIFLLANVKVINSSTFVDDPELYEILESYDAVNLCLSVPFDEAVIATTIDKISKSINDKKPWAKLKLTDIHKHVRLNKLILSNQIRILKIHVLSF